ncbi:response regulator [Methylobacterium mesophilicum SR1.6/6]|uniref:Response regulator n=1 Tax=Methylobacterium mesophilicum SR1.6/6 TaxID=908290 RepID=A0A6B9FEV1_9HYPH|nr:response regulator [Methylobacterium mesophilicum]QGY01563.1 response regulator [Methylobacterium mesophilicum SR1.6/6]
MPDPARPLAGHRILVVEDEYLIAMDVKRWLMAAGATVVGPVPSVDQALDLIEDDGLTAAVLDVNLGSGNTVYPVASELRASGVPYLFATGDVKLSDEDDYRGRPRLTKPYLEAELVRAVTELVAGSTSSS